MFSLHAKSYSEILSHTAESTMKTVVRVDSIIALSGAGAAR